MTYVYYTGTVLATFFVWALIHEMSHVVAYKYTVGLYSYKVILYPHVYNNRFYFASMSGRAKRQPSASQQFIISMAPRVPDYIAILAIAFLCTFTEPELWSRLLVVFLAGSIIDLFVGSMGIDKGSDLQVAAGAVPKMSIWGWRLLQGFIIICAIANITNFFIR